MDTYAILGVPRNATDKAIRAAYRKLSKINHPDIGGDAAKFAEIKFAHDVLMHVERRLLFDQTGRVEEAKADNTQAEVLNFLSAALNAAIAQGHGPEFDFVAALRNECDTHLKSIAVQRKENEAKIRNLEKLAGRFTSKNGKPNILRHMVDSQIVEAKRPLAHCDNVERILKSAKDILDDHSFKIAKVTGTVQNQNYGTFGSTFFYKSGLGK